MKTQEHYTEKLYRLTLLTFILVLTSVVLTTIVLFIK